ncbi:hypothetical protein L198_00085 [Cryptococcus wingfieldii CBS 7118]|uniref:GST N-terminal domain-containing protein n=1 Tax=Cryptococcus wingfieldii CBS 7118 TaxID=1295528 RepID=A0A1E3K5D5_9TREE|nr:hypothetical protein L198_00085 [Cryptococcus wingfieldii CBS 7118]ODO08360.1 hypothetical protein L198_00085 [Cryptococcus wingfieldii CBS 7118]
MPKYTLYQLVGDAEKPDGRALSPHVWKSKLDLAFFEQEVKKVGKTFPQIRGELAESTKNPAVTVPTIVDEDDTIITDSWKVAEYLEAKHGTPEKSLFGGKAGKEFAKFIEIWSNTTLANELRPLIAPAIYEHFDAPSRAYFLKSKWQNDPSLFSAHQTKFSSPSVLDAQLASARNRLTVIEALLGYKKEKDEPLWLTGKPSHADFALFGWFAVSRVNGSVEKGVWRHEENPLVGEWLDLVLGSGLVDKSQLD